MTSTFWRNAWRYRERAYRHTYWDAGTSLSHILAVAASAHVATELVFGYADPLVNALLDIDGVRESTVALVALGNAEGGPPNAPTFGRLDLPTRRLSSAEVTFHAITDMHLASSLRTGAEAAQWRSRQWHRPAPQPTGELTELRPLPDDRLDPRPVEQIIFRRRSTRNYDTDAEIPFDAFSTLLERSTRGVASDVLTPGAPLTELYLIVNAVEGLAPGVYLHHPAAGRGRAPARGHVPQGGHPHRSEPAVRGRCAREPLLPRAPAVDPGAVRQPRLPPRRSSKALCTPASCTSARTPWGWARWARRRSTTRWSSSSPRTRTGKDYMFVTVFGKRRRTRQS